MPRPLALALALAALLALAAACGSDDAGPADAPADADTLDADDLADDAAAGDAGEAEDADALGPPPPAIPGTAAAFDLDAAWDTPEGFYAFPWPSDLRLTAAGAPDLAGFPNPNQNDLVAGLSSVVGQHEGWTQTPVAWFRFDAPLAPRAPGDTVPVDDASPLLLVDVDPASPTRGRRVPVIAHTLDPDPFTPPGLLGVAPRPGFVLPPRTTWAFVVRRGLGDATGAPLGVPAALRALAAGHAPPGPRGDAARALYAPLWETLDALGVPRDDVAAATVFTTGDPVAALYDLTEAIRAAWTVSLDDLHVDPDDGADHPRFCELVGTATLPQLQRGEPPFDTEGLFEIGPDGLPVEQRLETLPIVLTLPKQPMPAGGYPLVLYLHGSGGDSAQVVDRGAIKKPGGPATKGEGPAHVLAPFGFAAFGSALPLNPERYPGASSIQYLNLNNLATFRDIFRQGVAEQRLLLDALLAVEIPPETVAACDGLSLPPGETAYRLAARPVFAMGQSMGGMYVNLLGPVEPRIEAVAPTGAGGYWSWFITVTELLDAAPLLAIALQSDAALSVLHPALHVAQLAWDPVEPLVFVSRLARDPLPGHPARPIYEPVGLDDVYFPTVVYDAMVLAYGHGQAGDTVWPSMQAALALDGRAGLLPYPVAGNALSTTGEPYTAAAVQYAGDGLANAHYVFQQLDAVKHQYGCFFSSYLQTGTAVIPAPAPLGTPCPLAD